MKSAYGGYFVRMYQPRDTELNMTDGGSADLRWPLILEIVMFSLMFNTMPDTDAILNWHAARSKVYKTFAEQSDLQISEVYFEFSAPDAGWAYVSVYCDGNKLHTFPISAAFDPFDDIKVWMEDIVNDFKLSSDICIDAEGQTIILHYEHLRLAEVGGGCKFVHQDRELDEWQSYDAMSCPDLGLFYLYDSGAMDIPVVCCCETKQLLFALYHAMLEFARNGKHDIGKEWYYMDRDDNGDPTENRLTLYNRIKSPMIEWGIYSDHAFRHLRPTFNKKEAIREAIHMWPDWGEACFWDDNGIGSGDTHYLLYGDEQNEQEIDLTSVDGLQEWYDKFDHQDIPNGMTNEDRIKWLTQGWEVAMKVRQLLPPHIDLYYMWKSCEGIKDKNGFVKELARIVPDIRDVDERSCNRMKFKLY